MTLPQSAEAAPDTRSSREIHLEAQVKMLLSKSQRIAEVRKEEVARYERNLAALRAHADEVTRASGKRRRELEEAEQKLIGVLRERPVLIARIEAGAERRSAMTHVLHALITCEDDESLTDDQYDARMTEVARRARILVQEEREAILTERGSL